jgi:FixJ family two-component response regulator
MPEAPGSSDSGEVRTNMLVASAQTETWNGNVQMRSDGQSKAMQLGGVVHVIDDDPSIKKAVGRLLSAAGYDVRTYESSGDFLIRRAEAQSDECLLLDIHLSGPSGLELQESLLHMTPAIPVIFLTAHGDVASCARAMKNGAIDFLTKPVKREPLLEAIRIALSRSRERRVIHEELDRFRASFQTLSDREKQVLAGVVIGKLNKQIAAELGMAERTVKAHRSHLMQKMGAKSLAELVHISDIMSFPALRLR